MPLPSLYIIHLLFNPSHSFIHNLTHLLIPLLPPHAHDRCHYSCHYSYIMQVNEQIGSGDWSDGAELGSTWEGRNSFSYGRQTPSVGLQSKSQGQSSGQIAGLATELVCKRFLILMPCMLCSTTYSSSQIFILSHQRSQFHS